MRNVAVALVVLAAVPLLGATRPQNDAVTIGTGCFYDVILTVEQIGRVCHAGQNPEFSAALAEDIARLDKMFVERGESTADIVAAKARTLRMTPAGDSRICKGDGDQLYQMLLKAGPADLGKTTDAIVARPGKPTYGDCF